MSLGQGRMTGVMTENMSLIRQNDLDLWHVGTKSQQKELKEIPLLCLTSMKETDGGNQSNNGRLTLAGFSILIQLETRRTPAVEASNGVTAESLTPSICLLTFIHIWGERKDKIHLIVQA